MSSSSTSYIVAPNSTVNLTPYIPEQTQLNGTGPLLDLIPQIISNLPTPVAVPLFNVPGITAVFTSLSSVVAGIYMVQANFLLETTSGSWSSAEQITLSVATDSLTGFVNGPEITMQPAYFSLASAATQPIYATVTGLLELNATAFINCLVTRSGGGITTNKTGALVSLTAQRIA
jgi:hypothetical protein